MISSSTRLAIVHIARTGNLEFQLTAKTLHFPNHLPAGRVRGVRTCHRNAQKVTAKCSLAGESWLYCSLIGAGQMAPMLQTHSSTLTSLAHDKNAASLPSAQETSLVDDHIIHGSSRVGIVQGFASKNNIGQRLLRKLFIEKYYSLQLLKLAPFPFDPFFFPPSLSLLNYPVTLLTSVSVRIFARVPPP